MPKDHKICQKSTKYAKRPQNVPNDHKSIENDKNIQNDHKSTKIFHSGAFQNA
jgi:hypothetical protein